MGTLVASCGFDIDALHAVPGMCEAQMAEVIAERLGQNDVSLRSKHSSQWV